MQAAANLVLPQLWRLVRALALPLLLVHFNIRAVHFDVARSVSLVGYHVGGASVSYISDHTDHPVANTISRLPLGIIAGIVSVFASSFTKYVSAKRLIVGGLALVTVATVLLPFADTPERYWPFIFPAFLVGSLAAMTVYSTTK